MVDVIRFQPIYQDRVWGGRGLETSLGRTLPAGRPIGESWEIVDRPEAQSLVKSGGKSGRTIRQLIAADPKQIMGPTWPAAKPFPILVKWLDCRERLSLQVHPPASVAAELKGEPKTENWFIAENAPGAQLIVGLKRGVTRTQFEEALAAGTLESCLHRFPVTAGDSILVQSGQLHAIDAGNLILEIQQNSDTTYRVYDWGRKGLDGKPREMHVAQSLRSIRWDHFEPAAVRAAPLSAVIADCAEFRIRRVVLGKGEKLVLPANEQPRILSLVTGSASVGGGEAGKKLSGGQLKRGDNVLLPYGGAFVVRSPEIAVLLLTENFIGSA